MNVPMKTKTNVIQTPCVPTPKDHMFAAASEDMKATAEVAQVILCTFFRNKVFFFFFIFFAQSNIYFTSSCLIRLFSFLWSERVLPGRSMCL